MRDHEESECGIREAKEQNVGGGSAYNNDTIPIGGLGMSGIETNLKPTANVLLLGRSMWKGK